MSEWVSVNDRMLDGRCIAYTPDQSPDMTYRIIPEGLFRMAAKSATHWTPLPDPPETQS